MIIYVSRTVRILADGDRSFTLQRRHKHEEGKQAGTISWRNRGFYSRLDHVCTAILEKELCENNSTVQLKELLAIIKQVALRLEEVSGAARAVLASTHPPVEMHMPPEPEELVEAS